MVKEFYGTKPNKNQARIEFGLPTDATIFGNIGHIKPYNGLEFIIEAFIKFTKNKIHKKNYIYVLLEHLPKINIYLH